MTDGAELAPAAPVADEVAQVGGKFAQLPRQDAAKLGDVLCSMGAWRLAAAAQEEYVARKTRRRAGMVKTVVQHAKKTVDFRDQVGLVRNFPAQRILHGFVRVNAARGQSIDVGRIVAFGVYPESARRILQSEDDFRTAIADFAPAHGVQIRVGPQVKRATRGDAKAPAQRVDLFLACLLYTSDAADDLYTV